MAKRKSVKKIVLKNDNSNINKHIGTKLRQKRTLLGLSQEGLGNILDITFQQVQKYESGITKISIERLLDICEIFKTSISFFFEGYSADKNDAEFALNDEKTGFNHNNISLDKRALELVKMFYSIKDPKVAKQVFNLIKSISEQQSEEEFSSED
ncbi:MAG: transcriptional repressor DicA [Alphaproteobacteria bacterium ADurb.Bin438]|nr:MAG: transcriptional repressor DicA [Alphaproteobacteria bacterium ADurb.Bin438]